MTITWNGTEASWDSQEAVAPATIALPPVNLALSFEDTDETELTGDGSVGDPYVLRATDHLALLQTQTDAHFVLGKNVALPSTWSGADFSGTLDGNSHYIDATGSMVAYGLFKGLVASGRVRNLGIVGGTFYSPLGSAGYKATFCSVLGEEYAWGSSPMIENCYAKNCTVDTGGDRAGGLVGLQLGHYSEINTSYAACYRLNADGSRVGGIRGFKDRGSASYAYWDSDVWQSTSDGYRSYYSTQDTYPKTTAEMQQEATFVGFDFANVWRIVVGNYPTIRPAKALRLSWEEDPAWRTEHGAVHVSYEIARNGHLLTTHHQATNYVDTYLIDFAGTYDYDVRARLYVFSEARPAGEVDGMSDQVLPAFQHDAVGYLPLSGGIGQLLPTMAHDIAGLVAAAGPITHALSPIQHAASGFASLVTGGIDQGLPGITHASVGKVAAFGSISQGLPPIQHQASGKGVEDMPVVFAVVDTALRADLGPEPLATPAATNLHADGLDPIFEPPAP